MQTLQQNWAEWPNIHIRDGYKINEPLGPKIGNGNETVLAIPTWKNLTLCLCIGEGNRPIDQNNQLGNRPIDHNNQLGDITPQ